MNLWRIVWYGHLHTTKAGAKLVERGTVTFTDHRIPRAPQPHFHGRKFRRLMTDAVLRMTGYRK